MFLAALLAMTGVIAAGGPAAARDDEIGVGGRSRVEIRAVGIEQVGDDESPVRGAHDIGRIMVQRSAPRQLSAGSFVGDGAQLFHYLEVAAADQATVREQFWDLAVCAASRYDVPGLPVR